MSEENNVVENEVPSLDVGVVEVDDIFGNEEIEVEAEEDNETDDDDSTPKDESTDKDDDGGEDDGEEQEEAPEKDVATDRLEKRLADTRKAHDNAIKANKAILDKVANGEQLDADDLKSLAPESIEGADGIDDMVKGINDSLPVAIAVFSKLNPEKNAEAIQSDVNAFNELAKMDPTLITDLQAIPVSERAAHVITRGGELQEVFEAVKENGGSVTAAILGRGKVSSGKLEKETEAIREEIRAEFEDKYKDYTISASKKLKKAGSAPKKPTPEEVDHSNVSSEDVFG